MKYLINKLPDWLILVFKLLLISLVIFFKVDVVEKEEIDITSLLVDVNEINITELVAKAGDCLKQVVEYTQEVLNFIFKSGNGNNFTIDWSSFYTYLDSLNILELSAFFHITILILILIMLSNILSIIFGNEIISYLNLKNKNYPNLSRFFKLRLKFQKYSLIFNIAAMFILCLVVISIDLLVLI